MIPPGGWHFFQSDVRLEAPTLGDLYTTVEKYRAENGLPSGDVIGDVNSQICGRSPHFCHGVDKVTVNVTSVAHPTASIQLLNDIQTWATNLQNSQKPFALVSDEEAERRARICAGCQYNAQWKTGCSSCVVSVERITASVRQARDTHTTPRILGCHVLRHDNRTAAFIEKDALSTAPRLPDHCWLK
jgi:hypothetical protein